MGAEGGRGFAAGCVERLCSLRSGGVRLLFSSQVSIEQTFPTGVAKELDL